MSALDFIQHLVDTRLITQKVADKLRKQIDQAPKRVSTRSVAKTLVKKGYLEKDQIQAAVEDFKKTKFAEEEPDLQVVEDVDDEIVEVVEEVTDLVEVHDDEPAADVIDDVPPPLVGDSALLSDHAVEPVLDGDAGLQALQQTAFDLVLTDLHMPGINGMVKRPERIRVQAYNLQGELFDAEADGLFARAIQHELDHLDGVLFTDKMSETGKLTIRPELEELEIAFNNKRETGEMPDDAAIAQHLLEIEQKYAGTA